MAIKILDIYTYIVEGKDIRQIKEAIMQKDAYSGEEVAELLEDIVKQQRENNEKIASTGEFFAYLGQEVVPTEEIVGMHEFWLGEAFHASKEKEYNIKNLAAHVDKMYETRIKQLPNEEKQKAFAEAIYSIDWEKKDEKAARDVCHRIALVYLIQERMRRSISTKHPSLEQRVHEIVGANFKKHLGKYLKKPEDEHKIEKEFDLVSKIDFEKLRENYRTGVQSYIDAALQEKPTNYDESKLWLQKAKFLEEKGKIDDAADLFLGYDLYRSQSPDDFFYSLFLEFCQRHARKDLRLIQLYNSAIKGVLQLKDNQKINDVLLLTSLCQTYEGRAQAYDFLGMPAEAQKDREARQKLLEQI